MAALTTVAVINTDRSITVTWSTDDAIGAAAAAFIVDSTLDKVDVGKALRALMRAYNREAALNDTLADFRTSGTSVE